MDYVFDGTGTRPYVEDDAPGPQTAYGSSKLAGDEVVLASDAEAYVFRVGWVYGRRARNFLGAIQRLARERDELRVVADQYGGPTWSRAIAEQRLYRSGNGWQRVAKGERHLRAASIIWRRPTTPHGTVSHRQSSHGWISRRENRGQRYSQSRRQSTPLRRSVPCGRCWTVESCARHSPWRSRLGVSRLRNAWEMTLELRSALSQASRWIIR